MLRKILVVALIAACAASCVCGEDVSASQSTPDGPARGAVDVRPDDVTSGGGDADGAAAAAAAADEAEAAASQRGRHPGGKLVNLKAAGEVTERDVHPLLNLEAEHVVAPADRKRIEERVDEWIAAYTGRPVSCMDSQWMMADNSFFSFPEAPEPGVGGSTGVYKDCQLRYKGPFSQVEGFRTSDLFISGSTVAFSRTNLLVTRTGCRITWHGITTLQFDPQDNFHLKQARDFYDADKLRNSLRACELPEFDEGEILERDSAAAARAAAEAAGQAQTKAQNE